MLRVGALALLDPERPQVGRSSSCRQIGEAERSEAMRWPPRPSQRKRTTVR